MKIVTLGLIFTASLASAWSAPPRFSAATPMLVTDLQGSPVKGDPSQLTWSADGATLCLQTLEGDHPPLKTRYYLIRLAPAGVQGIDVAPEWATPYWSWKSSRMPPGHPELVIQVDTKNRGSQVPTQSLKAKADENMLDNAVAAQNVAEGSVVRTLTLGSEAIGTFVDQPLVPGTTFGWSPEPLHAVAYTKPNGRLAVMDLDGGTLDLDATTGISLPAWSPDGSRIAYVQKQGRHHYTVMQIPITRP